MTRHRTPSIGRRRPARLRTAFAALATGAALAAMLAAAPAHADANARYVVSVVSIRAVDESGPDLAGSDEIYGGYQATDPRTGSSITGFRTQFIKGFDSGETKQLDLEKQCLPPRQVLAFPSGRANFYDGRAGDRWTCQAVGSTPAGMTAPFTITGQLYDEEGCSSLFSDECAAGRKHVLGRWLDGDQNVGKGTLAFSVAGLSADLPAVGASRPYEMTHKVSGAHYKTLIFVQRVG